MHIPLVIAGAVSSAIAMTAVFAQSEFNDGSAQTKKRYSQQQRARLSNKVLEADYAV